MLQRCVKLKIVVVILSGEGNAGERWKTTIGLISKKATLHAQHTFFVHFFAFV